ncbi:MAG: PQQ-dependent sugar dehydrogenase [Gammaproteobacteria bacterium]|nr:PQQ-dependent sugar dehydrogenase [Gammaproteobacteria bacterium]
MQISNALSPLLLVLLIVSSGSSADSSTFDVRGSAGTRLTATAFDEFDTPWAMTFLPDGRLLVSEKTGALVLVGSDGRRRGVIEGIPATRAAGQGGLGDVVLHPAFADNGLVYLSYVERDGSRSGAVVVRGTLSLEQNGGRLRNLERIWEQIPKLDGNGHYSHRLAFGPDGRLFISSGDRQRQTPAQDLSNNLGTIVRLEADGSIPVDNPFADRGGVAREFWTVGHRNPLGLTFARDGTLYSNEMGPRGGDELNRIVPGENYGWPTVSDGENYSGRDIPDHATDPSFKAPLISWVPSISPAGLIIYDGDLFGSWRGQALMGGLSSRALVRVSIGADRATEQERFEWGERIREVEQGPDGALWVLEDGRGGRLVRLEPAD